MPPVRIDALRAEPEVNRLTDALGRLMQVNPPANLRVDFVDAPRLHCGHAEAVPAPDELRRA